MRGGILAQKYGLPAIMLTNFGCGPDSFTMKYLDEIIKGYPYMTIEIDDHTADAGLITRIEAFLDTLNKNIIPVENNVNFKDYNVIIKRNIPSYNPFLPDPDIMKKLEGRTLYYHWVSHGMNKILEAGFKVANIDAKALPPQNDRTEELARKYSSGLECHPYQITTGDIVKFTENKDFNQHKTALFLFTYDGSCRYSQYGFSYKIVLNNLGYSDVVLLTPLFSCRYDEMTGMFGLNFTQVLWKGWLCGGILENYLLATRPYEIEKGSADRAYLQAMDMVSTACSEFSSMKYLYDEKIIKALKDGIGLIKSVPVDKTIKRPKIGILGEFFTVISPWANNELFRKIESLGGEVRTNGLFSLTNFISFFSERYYPQENWKNSKFIDSYYYELRKHWLLNWAQKLEKEIDDESMIRLIPTKKMVDRISPFINPDLDPVSTTYLARIIDFAERGISGINYLIVLNCMLSNMTIPIIKKILSDYNNLPLLSTPYDGFKGTNTLTRIEAFIHQAKLYREKYLSEK
jgi:predicted nucleotide-binding protein (sugar kinase/HSP70/actin superfamily)